jgi:hypothetical protein
MPAHQALNLLVAAAAAAILAAMVAVPEIAGVSTWKIVLAVIGLGLFVAGGWRTSRP